MLDIAVVENTHIITIAYSGSLSTEDIEKAQEVMSRLTAEHDAVQLLLEYGEIDPGRIEPAAAWKDLQSIGMLQDMERIALVADQQWLQTITDAIGSIVSADVRTFDRGRRDEALTWLAS